MSARTYSTLPIHLRGALEAEARRQAKRDRKAARKAAPASPINTTSTDDKAGDLDAAQPNLDAATPAVSDPLANRARIAHHESATPAVQVGNHACANGAPLSYMPKHRVEPGIRCPQGAEEGRLPSTEPEQNDSLTEREPVSSRFKGGAQ